jgi:hypothetical protein
MAKAVLKRSSVVMSTYIKNQRKLPVSPGEKLEISQINKLMIHLRILE